MEMYLKSAFLICHPVFKFSQWNFVSIAFFFFDWEVRFLVSYSPHTKNLYSLSSWLPRGISTLKPLKSNLFTVCTTQI